MQRFDRIVPRGSATAALVLTAVMAWPSAGWSRTAGPACDVTAVVNRLLKNWAGALEESWKPTINPKPIVDQYAVRAVLLPTCANGPEIGREQITGYFQHFLEAEPVVEAFEKPSVGGNCKTPFASGLYTFKLNGGAGERLRARYTFIFQRTGDAWLITQHHSSLEPVARPGEPKSACK